MPSYKAPLEDYHFLLFDLFRLQDHKDLPGFENLDEDLVMSALEGGAKICEEVLQPLNQVGDEHGCTFENGIVRTPPGFKAAYDTFYAGGWNALGAPEALGGAGLPPAVTLLMTEMTCSANQSFSMYVGLTTAAYGALQSGGAPWMREHIVPKLLAGEWAGTMCLTEPHCGTDLRLMKSKAVAQEDGTYRLTGTKIFISGGEHDMADNIIHMVIAKIPGADGRLQDDLAQVNFFMVPKFLVSEGGRMGARNGVFCGGIEKKMGIKGSSTCTMNFDDAVAYRLGPAPEQTTGSEHKRSAGMAGMFAMMNGARLGVGIMGIALAEVACQNAAIYTRERLTGRALTGAKAPDKPADPIIVHPDVRRMLLHARSFTEGARAMAIWVSTLFAIARSPRSEAEREEASLLADLVTPVVKAFFTDMSFEAVNAAMQCLGGHGYIRDHGMEQFVRDARINQVYEGANGIQALDLVGRKLGRKGGRAPFALFAKIKSFVAELQSGPACAHAEPLGEGLARLEAATLWLAENGMKNPDNAGAGSVDYLRLFGIVMVGWFWGQSAERAALRLSEGSQNKEFYERKLVLARYWMERMMPETAVLLERIKAGSEGLMALDAARF
jgi:alkylation response protein AidB-like acyl-CoA dehydrogenase